MTSKMSVASLVDQLETERSTFDENAYPLAKYQQDAFQLCCDLLREPNVSKPTKRDYARLRARTLLLDVFTGLGAEVFVLCTLAVSITDLSKVPHKHALPTLREWWKKASHPPGLTVTATDLCVANAIGTLDAPGRKRLSPEDNPEYPSSKRTQPGSGPVNHSYARAEGHLQIAREDEELGSPQSLAVLPEASTQNFAPGDVATLLPNQPPESVFDLSLKDLLGFLQKQEADYPKLQMMCPWNGSPLPSINISAGTANGLGGKVELSIQSALKLMEYVNDSNGVSSATKVSH